MLTQFIVLSTVLAAGQPHGRDVLDFRDSGRLLDGGSLNTSAKDTLAKALGNKRDVTSASVVICLGKPPQSKPISSVAVSRQLRGLLRDIDIDYAFNIVARYHNTRVCPAGLMVEVSRSIRRGSVPEASVLSQVGTTTARIDAREIPLRKGSLVPQGAIVETGSASACTVLLPSGAVVKVRQNSRVRLKELTRPTQKKSNNGSGTVRLKLLAGRLWARLLKTTGLSKRPKMEVQTGNAVAGVRGTTFQVGTTPRASESSLAVFGGLVAMKAGEEEKEVPKGFSLVAGAGLGEVEPLPSAPTKLTPQHGTFDRRAFVRWDPVPSAVGYRVELASDVEFLEVLYAEEFAQTTLKLVAPPGTYFWRVVTLAPHGLESAPSQLYEISFR